jgi:hypothetical protein
VAELIELAREIESLKLECVARGVKEKTPGCKVKIVGWCGMQRLV